MMRHKTFVMWFWKRRANWSGDRPPFARRSAASCAHLPTRVTGVNIWSEVQYLIYGCDWFKVYDIIEALYARMQEHDRGGGGNDAPKFADALNQFFIEEGIGWQLEDGEIVTRGTEAFEAAVHTAVSELKNSGRPTAATRIQEALYALSRRPEPDLAGAISHAIAALECVAGDITGDTKATLGDFLKHHPDLFGTLRKALEGIWGYACNEGARPERRASNRRVKKRSLSSIYPHPWWLI
jgi:AbiJ N-terminal domain 4